MKYQPDELFRSTAPYYARYRAGYPPQMLTHLAERFGLDGTQLTLDLGCGTGQIAIPLAAHVREVVAVDPEPSMLDEGRALADQQGITNIDWRRGDSYHLAELGLHNVALTTMGASFHWMDRPAVLKALDHIIQPGGAVVVVSDGAPERAGKPGWNEIVTAVRTRWLGAERRAGSGTYTHPTQRHEEILAESSFGHIEVVDWTWAQERDLDSVIGLQFSYSYSAPALLGEKADEFAAELRRELLAANPSGRWNETVHTEAIIATRPSRSVHTPLTQ